MKFLRSQAHHLDPVVMVGKQGVTEAVMTGVDEALNSHELIKIRFQEFKAQKKSLSRKIADETGSCLAGMIGNIAILYREQEDPDRRRIHVPSNK